MSERIYVIEDDENIQEIIKLSLESSGYQITLFNNAIDAIVAIHEDTPDLAIFDVMLPELDGISAIKQIRKTNTTLPILILSAKDREIDKVRGLDSGCDDYMTKPFGVLELAARVRSLLRRSQHHSKVIKTTSLENDKSVSSVKFNTKGRIIYITINYVSDTSLEDAKAKAATSIAKLSEDILSYYDIDFTIKCEKSENSEGFTLLGAKNVAGSGLVWNNNTPVESDEK